MSDVPGDLDGRRRGPTVFPLVALPAWAADIVGGVLVAAAIVGVASGAIQAIWYRLALPTSPLGSFGDLRQPQLSLGDRLQLLARGTDSFTAVLVALGALCLVIAARTDDRDARWRLRGLWTAGAVGAVVVVANAAAGLEILLHGPGVYLPELVANRLASIIGLLGPIALGAGTMFCVRVHLRSEPAFETAQAPERDLGVDG